MKRGSITFVKTKSDSQNKTNKIAKINIRLLLSTRPYVFEENFENGPTQDVPYFSQAGIFFKISIYVASGVILPVAGLLRMGTGLNTIMKENLPSRWKEYIKSVKSPQLRKANF